MDAECDRDDNIDTSHSSGYEVAGAIVSRQLPMRTQLADRI